MLADMIFDDPVLLADVNRIIHPVVGKDFLNWCGSFTSVPFVIQESAILFESQRHTICLILLFWLLHP